MNSLYKLLHQLGLNISEQITLCVLLYKYQNGIELNIEPSAIISLMKLQEMGYVELGDYDITLTDTALDLLNRCDKPNTMDFVKHVHNLCNMVEYNTKNDVHIGFKVRYNETINPDWFIELAYNPLIKNTPSPARMYNGYLYALDKIEIGIDNKWYWRGYNKEKWNILNEDINQCYLYVTYKKL